MRQPVIFHHEVHPNFATNSTPDEWRACAALVAAIYAQSSENYSDPLGDLCRQLEAAAGSIGPRGTGLVCTMVHDPMAGFIEVSIDNPAAGTSHQALRIWDNAFRI